MGGCLVLLALSPSASVVHGAGSNASAAPVGILFTPYKTYRDAAEAIEAALKEAGHRCILVELPVEADKAVARLIDAKPGVIVAAGASAAAIALEKIPRVPIIFCMVPNALDADFLPGGDTRQSRLAGVATDVSPTEQVAWITKLCPDVRNIGVLCSDHSKRTTEAIRAAAKTRGVTVTPIESDKDEFPKAIDALNSKGCDAVLMLPDAKVYNSANVQRLLLWGIRQKKPVWAFSTNIVKAGAFAGQFADPQSLNRQTAELAARIVNGAPISKVGLVYPQREQSAVNERTAELIGIPLDPRILESIAVRYGKEQ